MYTLKTIARRGTALGMAVSLIVATILPASAAFADALNPLTERSLLLSSSAPGWQNTDGSGNSTYAPAGSGPNGSKTGETFTFTVSSTDTVKGMSFQYCTAAAGLCRGPGNNQGDARGTFDGSVPDDWDGISTREVNEGTGGAHESQRSDLDIVGTFGQQTLPSLPTFSGQYGGDDQVPDEPDSADYSGGASDPDYLADMDLYNDYIAGLTGVSDGNFQIFVDGVATAATDWTMTVDNAEDQEWVDQPGEEGLTGKNNYLILTSATGMALTAGQEVKVVFAASDSAYITNPGSDEFFVKINTYDTDDDDDSVDTDGDSGDGSQGYTNITTLAENTHVIDGGVTVANVMTDSIHIVTKVLETMSFSVGIQNPDTVDRDNGAGSGVEHGRCEVMDQDSVRTGLTNNRLNLGNPNAEYSLETGKAWDVYSYWRLSSNSSGGATVYYSGDTLANTSGDKIADMPTEQLSNPGSEQFGLGFVDAGADEFANTLDSGDGAAYVDGGDTFASGWQVRSYPFITLSTQTGAPYDTLAAQAASTGYDEASGRINVDGPNPIEAKFQFHASSNTIPELIAKQNETVISCATAKMRYIGNIGADTPAGVYTTKINYLAAPQY